MRRVRRAATAASVLAVALASVASATDYKGTVDYLSSVSVTIENGHATALEGQTGRLPCADGQTADPVRFSLAAPVPLIGPSIHAVGTSRDASGDSFEWTVDGRLSLDRHKVSGTVEVLGTTTHGACSASFPFDAIVPPQPTALPVRRTFSPRSNNRSFNPAVAFDYRSDSITHLTASVSTVCPEGTALPASLNSTAYGVDPIRVQNGRFLVDTDVLDAHGVVTHVVLRGTIAGRRASGRLDSYRSENLDGRISRCVRHTIWVSASAKAVTSVAPKPKPAVSPKPKPASGDHVKPRLRVYPGSATRGKTAFVDLRVSDNSGAVRLRIWLSYEGHEIVYGSFGYRHVSWEEKPTFYTKQPLPKSFPAGTYSACAKATDRAGNSAQSCAPYQVR